MLCNKNNYFLLIENIKDIDLKNIKIRNKFSIVYRNNKKIDNLNDLHKFRRKCMLKAIKFFIANDYLLAITLNSDGIYLSSFNKSLKSLCYKKSYFQIIGSAHNFKEISLKVKQGCSIILLSKLFRVNYDKQATWLGVVKFNSLSKVCDKLIPLGGINIGNLNQLKNVFGEGFALLSELKKKPAKLISRLF
jgi:thiamine-phosphate pyrophosphorylase